MAAWGNDGIAYIVHMVISAAVVCFPSHSCVATETRAVNQQWVLTWKLTWYMNSVSFFVLLWPGIVIINTYVNEDSGVVDMMIGSNWKVEGNFCSMLSLFRPEWLIPLCFCMHTCNVFILLEHFLCTLVNYSAEWLLRLSSCGFFFPYIEFHIAYVLPVPTVG